MRLRFTYLGIVALVSGFASRDLRAQTDSISGMFRDALTEVAKASELPRLDSAALLAGVRREIRIYIIGMGQPYSVLRLVEHTHGVDGQIGWFWPSPTWMRVYSSAAEERRDREEGRAYEAQVRGYMDTTYGCRATAQTRAMNVCWLPPRPGRVVWAQLLAQLDSLGVNSVPWPVRPRMGSDGWGIFVELRRPAGYRGYYYWSPDSASTDVGERAAARVADAVGVAFSIHRLANR
jgi:hypothetical protein